MQRRWRLKQQIKQHLLNFLWNLSRLPVIGSQIPSRFHRRPVKQLFIFQMGKVGSRSVYQTLSACLPNTPIDHIHHIRTAGAILARNGIGSEMSEGTIRYMRRGMELDQLLRKTSKKQTVITMVREPLGRNISRLFQNLDEFGIQIDERTEPTVELLNTIESRFFEVFNPDSFQITWFEQEMNPVFHINVYEHPFPHEQGYQVIRTKRTDLLIIRLEDLDRVFPQAISEFLGIAPVPLKSTNIGSKKPYSKIYSAFKNHISFTDNQLEWYYQNKFATHFYSGAELESFKGKWKRTD